MYSQLKIIITLIFLSFSSCTKDEVTHVHVIFMNHLDVGYDGLFPDEFGFINNILNKYFHKYFPRAITVANKLREGGHKERLIYTTHPWLVSLFLDCPPDLVLSGIKLKCPNERDIKLFEIAVRAGDITWHAGPMNMQFEMADPSLARFGLRLSSDLDRSFGIVRKHRTLSQRDVPGTTQGLIPLMVEAGIEAISVGVNAVTSPPAVPPIFRWKFQNSSVIGMWHPGGYPDDPGRNTSQPGGLSRSDCATFPGFTHALCFAFRTDNSGPPMNTSEVLLNYKILRSEFPNAEVQASTFEDFVTALQPIKSQLPLVTKEFGDTWIQGVSSDPRKVAEMRAIMRSMSKCLQNSDCSLTDSRVYNASRFFIKLPEHTWGISSVFDQIDWTNQPFYKVLESKSMYLMYGIKTWQEQRNFSYLGIDALNNHSLATELKEELSQINAEMPSFAGYDPMNNKYSDQTCGGFIIQFNKDGAVSKLIDPLLKISWASNTDPLGQFIYQTLNQSDFDDFNKHYPYKTRFFLGIGKQNMSKNASPESRNWDTSLVDLYKSKEGCSFIAHINITDPQTLSYYGAPYLIFAKYNLTMETTNSGMKPKMEIELQWFKKAPTRLPESMYFMFKPIQNDGGRWMMHKLGQWLDPLNVIQNGSQRLHAIDRGVAYMKDQSHGMEIVSPDVALVNVLAPDLGVSVMPLPLTPIKSVNGMAFNLHNNVWDVNYIFWYPYEMRDMNQKFRFTVNFISAKQVSLDEI